MNGKLDVKYQIASYFFCIHQRIKDGQRWGLRSITKGVREVERFRVGMPVLVALAAEGIPASGTVNKSKDVEKTEL